MLFLLVDDIIENDDDKDWNDHGQPDLNIGEHLATPLLNILQKAIDTQSK